MAPKRTRRRRPPQYGMPRFQRDMMDVTKMAVAGTVGIGMIGAVGSVLKK